MPIPVRGGDRINVDFHFNPVPALHLFFRSGGDSRNGFPFPQLEQPSFEGSTFVQNGGAHMISPGLLEITGVPAGRYNVHILGRRLEAVDLTTNGQEVNTATAEDPATVKVSVRMVGGAPVPDGLMVGLQPSRKGTIPLVVVDNKGQAELGQVDPGKYEVVVGAQTKRYSIERMAAEGGDVSGHTLSVAAGSTPLLSISVLSGSAEVHGIAKRDGKGFAGAMIVLVPKDPELDHDLFRRDQSDMDGTFVFHSVISGTYTVLAIQDGWDLNWSCTAVISAYRKGGRTIQVGDRSMEIAEAVQVQSK